MSKYKIGEGTNECPLPYDDGCPHLMKNGKCELADPRDDCDDYACYSEDDEDEDEQ